MKKRLYILRDLGILVAVVGTIFMASVGISRLFTVRKDRKQERFLVLESKLKLFFQNHLLSYEERLEASEVTEAMNTILDRLTAAIDHMPCEPEVMVFESPVVNALAFPGGLIVVYSGIIERSESAEEIAAVLAHELGHVVKRDAMKSLARQIGLSALFAIVGGKQTEVLVEKVMKEAVNIRFSRAIENRADEFAIELLIKAEIDPVHLGRVLESLKEEMEKYPQFIVKYLDTHPDIDSRIQKAFAASKKAKHTVTPLDIDWDAVQQTLNPGQDKEEESHTAQ